MRALASGVVLGEPARTMAGLSNVRSGLRRQYPPEPEYTLLALLAGAGLSLALLDVLQPSSQEAVSAIARIAGDTAKV